MGWNSNFDYVRTSSASKPILPSASTLSKSPYSTSVLKQLIHRNVKPPPKLYSLDALYKGLKVSESGKIIKSKTRVGDYISKVLGVEAQVCKGLKLLPDTSSMPVKIRRFPDVTIADRSGATFFICEVESNSSYKDTTLKLAIHLAQMLSSLRNRCIQEESLQGFYFPFESVECVLLVTVTWKFNEMRFVEDHLPIMHCDVPAHLKRVYKKNKDLWGKRWEETKCYLFAFPVCQSNIAGVFGPGAKQLMSGHSVVIVNPTQQLVHKIPMNQQEESRLFHLLRFGLRSKSIGFPISNEVFPFTYFTYPLYLPPLLPSEIKKNLYWYLQVLVQIVEELHQLNIAHLDIRRENVCVATDFSTLVLIDLDRSVKANTTANIISSDFEPENDMYYPSSSDRKWTAENLDWKQVGLLFYQLFKDDTDHRDYKICLPFFEKLVFTGKK